MKLLLRNPILSSKEVELLLFLWKFRLATFETLRRIAFPSLSAKSAYDRLRKLRSGGFVSVVKIEGRADRVWRLEKRGMDYLTHHVLPELKANRFKPHYNYHDLLASAALIGEWFCGTPRGVRIISEQEMKTVEIAELTRNFPQGMDHHPDGIWILNSGEETKRLALEVELSAKSSKRYQEVGVFYASDTFFDHVVWIIRSKDHGNQILTATRKFGIPRDGVHLFVLLEDFKENLWQSKIRNGDFNGKSLASFFGLMLQRDFINSREPGIISGSPSGHQSVIREHPSPLLDFRFNLGVKRSSENQSTPTSQQLNLYGPYSI